MVNWLKIQLGSDVENNYRIYADGVAYSLHAAGQHKIMDWFEDGEHVDVLPVLTGGKPVVYLFSPESIEACVKLSLVPEWSLSAIYPVVPIKAHTAHCKEEVRWRVRTHLNGELTELTTELDVAYLFWEAQ